MSYQQAGDAQVSDRFKSRVRGAFSDLAYNVLAAVQDSGSIEDDASRDLTTEASKNFVHAFIQGTARATLDVMASYMALNPTVAADPFGDGANDDSAMNWQMKHIWDVMVDMG